MARPGELIATVATIDATSGAYASRDVVQRDDGTAVVGQRHDAHHRPHVVAERQLVLELGTMTGEDLGERVDRRHDDLSRRRR